MKLLSYVACVSMIAIAGCSESLDAVDSTCVRLIDQKEFPATAFRYTSNKYPEYWRVEIQGRDLSITREGFGDWDCGADSTSTGAIQF